MRKRINNQIDRLYFLDENTCVMCMDQVSNQGPRTKDKMKTVNYYSKLSKTFTIYISYNLHYTMK